MRDPTGLVPCKLTKNPPKVIRIGPSTPTRATAGGLEISGSTSPSPINHQPTQIVLCERTRTVFVEYVCNEDVCGLSLPRKRSLPVQVVDQWRIKLPKEDFVELVAVVVETPVPWHNIAWYQIAPGSDDRGIAAGACASSSAGRKWPAPSPDAEIDVPETMLQ
jgi:hypothetical protein